MNYLIKNATIVNEGKIKKGSVKIVNGIIDDILPAEEDPYPETELQIVDAEGLLLLPGVIDDQVHFREPGLTHKADIYTESRAAVAGGITSFMEMPNTIPQAVTIPLLEEKYRIASEKSLANYSFYFGATNENSAELKKLNSQNICGVKVFMGSSTGNMLVDNEKTLSKIFAESPLLVATHCEDEETIRANKEFYMGKFGDSMSVEFHPKIRSAEACYISSSKAVALAQKYNTRLHILHISTKKELELFEAKKVLEKRITCEACVHHLWFSDRDYDKYGNRIKWNPAIKTETDRLAIIDAVNSDRIDVIATDHAPHTLSEKEGTIFKAMSGGPLVQHSLQVMLQLEKQGYFTLEKVVEKMCHTPAQLFRIDKRGYVKKGYFADLVLVNPNKKHIVLNENILYKCGWSPFENVTFDSTIEATFVNGNLVYKDGKFDETTRGERLTFNHQ